MSKQILVNSSPYETRVATLEDGEIKSLHIEREEDRNVVGNIYKGLVKRVLPGMQAAFLELGLERTAFLYVDDIIDEPFGTEFDYGEDEGEGGEGDSEFEGDLDGDLDGEDPLDPEGPEEEAAPGAEPALGAPAQAGPEGEASPQAPLAAATTAAPAVANAGPAPTPTPANEFPNEDEDDNRFNRAHPDDRRDFRGPPNPGGDRPPRDDRPREGGHRDDRDRNRGPGGPGQGQGGGRHRDRTRDHRGGDRGGDRNRHAQHRDDRDRNRGQGGPGRDHRDQGGGRHPDDRNRGQGGPGRDNHDQNRFRDDRPREGGGRPDEARLDDRIRGPGDLSERLPDQNRGPREGGRDPRDERPMPPRDDRDFNQDLGEPREFQDEQGEPGPGQPEALHADQPPGEGGNAPRPERRPDDLVDIVREARMNSQRNAGGDDDFYPQDRHRGGGDFNREGGGRDQGRDNRDQGRDPRRDQGRDRNQDRHAGGGGGGDHRGGGRDRGRGGRGRHGGGGGGGGPQRAHRRGGRGGGGGGGGGRSRRRERRNVEIQDLLKEGQELLVQVAKAPIGTKGARLTTHISLPGRNLVLMPTVKHLGISRRIESERERRRLREIFTKRIRTNGEVGFIIRTVAEGKSYRELKADADYLLHLWEQIQENTKKKKAPALIHEDLGLALKTMRDDFTDDVDSLVIDNQQDYDNVLDFISQFSPRLKGKVKLFRGPSQLFEHYGIEAEISRALGKKVWLKSGGYLLIDQSEALTAIDVNTGRYVGSKSLEETILKTNLEAVKEISYQLRIRNVGGIIIIDLIDMENAGNRKKVYDALQEALSEDKAKTNILKISELGLVEMTRKRTHEDLVRYLTEQCSYCEGRGYHKSRRTICFEIFREIEKEAIATTHKNIVVFANSEVIGRITKEEKTHWKGLEERLQRQIVVKADPNFHVEQFEVFSKP